MGHSPTSPPVFRNKSLEAKRLAAEDRRRADALLRKRKSRQSEVHDRIDRMATSWLKKSLDQAGPAAAARIVGLFHRVAKTPSKLIDDSKFLFPLFFVGELLPRAIRPIETWRPKNHNADRQFASLLRHLFAEYFVQMWFDSAWDWAGGNADESWRDWFINVGQGRSLRTQEDLPIALTKRMAQAALYAPPRLTVPQAVRWGQVIGLGGDRRLAKAVVASRLSEFVESEPFWQSVLRLLAIGPSLDPAQVGPLIDYVHEQRFPLQPVRDRAGRVVCRRPTESDYSIKGRAVASLLRQMTAWHDRLADPPDNFPDIAWPSCGVGEWDFVDQDASGVRHYSVREILCSYGLFDEGRKLHHCVASYVEDCQAGKAAIFQLRARTAQDITATESINRNDAVSAESRLVTLELDVRQRKVVQARGKFNRRPTKAEQRLIRAWARHERLTIASYVL